MTATTDQQTIAEPLCQCGVGNPHRLSEHPGGDMHDSAADEIAHLQGHLEEDQHTIAELARHNQELTSELFAAELGKKDAEIRMGLMEDTLIEYREIASSTERHAKKAEATIATLTADIARWTDAYAALAADLAILQRTVEMQTALVTATAGVVAEVRRLAAVDHGVAWPDLVHALAALDKVAKS